MTRAVIRLMGVVNVTPDSFSDGGCSWIRAPRSRTGWQLAREGADILDVGGESTRPGAEPVAPRRSCGGCCRWSRVLPRWRALDHLDRHGQGSRLRSAALDAGATLVNDVSALRGDPEMAQVVAQSGAECCLMHMLGEPRTMQREPSYGDVVDDVKAFLEQRLAFAVREGIPEERVLLDPGIGFGKTLEHNLELLAPPPRAGRPRPPAGDWYLAQELPWADRRGGSAGASRSEATCGPGVGRGQAPGTIATNVLACERGASVFRVHDVAPARDALEVAAATLGARDATARVTRTTRGDAADRPDARRLTTVGTRSMERSEPEGEDYEDEGDGRRGRASSRSRSRSPASRFTPTLA